MKSFRFSVAGLLFFCPPLWADKSLCISNNNPFHQFHYIPCLSSVTQADSFQLALSSELSNIFYYDEAKLLNTEQVVVDGEITRQRLQFEKQVGGALIGVEITQVGFAAGNWDPAIEGWHSTFNFVNWDRENYPQNELRYSYQSESGSVIISEPQSTNRYAYHLGYVLERNPWLSDVRLGYSKTEQSQLMSPSSSWLSVQTPEYALNAKHSLQAVFGFSYSEASGDLSDIQNPWLYFGSITYDYRWRGHLSGVIQLSGNSAHYKSESVILGKSSSQFSTALFWQLTRGNTLSFALVEDLKIGASPDVTLQLAYRYKSH